MQVTPAVILGRDCPVFDIVRTMQVLADVVGLPAGEVTRLARPEPIFRDRGTPPAR